MDRSLGFGSTANDYAPYSDSVSLRLPYTVKLATDSKSLTHYTKGTPSQRTDDRKLRTESEDWELRTVICKSKKPTRACPLLLLLQSPVICRLSSLLSSVFCSQSSAPTACTHTVSGSVSLPSPGFFSPFPHGTGSLSVGQEYLALEDGPPMFRQGFTCPALLRFISMALSPTGLSPSLATLSRVFN